MSSNSLDKYRRDAQVKLQRGMENLHQAGQNTTLLGAALISLHGALEDHYRAQLASNSRIPSTKRTDILDPEKTKWIQLVELVGEYDTLEKVDRQRILRANHLRQSFAHGGEYEGTRDELEQYASFVQATVSGPSLGSLLTPSTSDIQAPLKVYCPRGKNCPGSTPYIIPECYLNKTQSELPSFILSKLTSKTGFWGTLAIAGVVGLAEYALEKEGIKPAYQVYRCPSCNARIVFRRYVGKKGPVCERVGDDVQGK